MNIVFLFFISNIYNIILQFLIIISQYILVKFKPILITIVLANNSFIFQNIIRKIESTSTGSQDKPSEDIIIYDCGSIEVTAPYGVAKASADE